jgi:hypothetical protein
MWIPAPIVRISGARSTTVTSSGGLDLRHAIAQARPPMPAPTTTMWSGKGARFWKHCSQYSSILKLESSMPTLLSPLQGSI